MEGAKSWWRGQRVGRGDKELVEGVKSWWRGQSPVRVHTCIMTIVCLTN